MDKEFEVWWEELWRGPTQHLTYKQITRSAWLASREATYKRCVEICNDASAAHLAEQLSLEPVLAIDYAEIELEANKKLGCAECANLIEREFGGKP